MVYTDKTHLIADTLEELHEFAERLGLKRRYFQNHEWHPHYDLFKRKKEEAVKLGAKLVSSKEIVKICRRTTYR